jgi:neuralized-like protein 4
VVTHDYINLNGVKTQSKYGDILENIQPGTIITMALTQTGSLSLTVGATTLEDLATGLPNHVYPVFDLYGKCEKISIMSGDVKNNSPINEEISSMITNEGENARQCEKADLEIHEKETDLPAAMPGTSM